MIAHSTESNKCSIFVTCPVLTYTSCHRPSRAGPLLTLPRLSDAKRHTALSCTMAGISSLSTATRSAGLAAEGDEGRDIWIVLPLHRARDAIAGSSLAWGWIRIIKRDPMPIS